MAPQSIESRKRNVGVFDHDAATHGGYLYTAESSLSSRLATTRSLDLIVDAAPLATRSVIDLGCGDGYFTRRIWAQARPRRMLGMDAAGAAVAQARQACTDERIEFAVGDVHRLPFPDDSFDVALLQSILHHDDDPGDVIREAFRVARTVVIHEPNGNNLGLKIIERTSSYHREHGEKSYRPAQMARWIRAAGAEVRLLRFAGFVPMFCPDWMARLTKRLEPLVEWTPVVKSQASAVYVVVAERVAAPAGR
jgi:SAM-dependent methyltransferase